MERIEPIRRDASVPRVDLPRLTPLEREQERQRREQKRRRRAPRPPRETPEEGRGGIDVRV